MNNEVVMFNTLAAMKDASIPRILNAGEGSKPLPPILVVQPGKDKSIPQPMTFSLLESYQKAGGKADYLFYPGMPHAFGHRPSAATSDLIVAMRDFINRQLLK